MKLIASEILKLIKQALPIYLVLLVFYPLLLGLFIEPSLFNPRYISINIAWILVFTIPVVLTKSNLLYKVVAFLFFLIGFIETSHWIVLNGPLSVTSLLILSNTYMQEAQEFTDIMMSPKFLLVLPYLFVFYKAIKYKPNKTFKLNHTAVIVLSLFPVIFILETAVNGRLIRKGSPNIAKVSFSFVDRIQMFKLALQDHKPRELKNVVSSSKSKKQTCVLILGESNSRRHMSIYGEKENTSPLLKKRDDVIIYDDVVSPWSSTIRSVLTILSQTNLEKEVEIINNIDILDVFHSAGYKNYWISNQCPIGVWDNQITEFSKKSDHNEFVNMTANSSYEATYTPSYDEKLFKPFEKVLKDTADKKFIVLHMIGNHLSYSKRYPNSFNQFKGGGTKQSDTKAEYFNSLLYTDFIVDSLFSMLDKQQQADSSRELSAIYISDHGENVYDYKNQVGHGYSKKVPKVNVEIPFLVWLSDSYKANQKTKTNEIKNHYHSPYVTDDLFHSLIDISGINTQYLDSTRSVFSPRFNDKRVRILCDGNDYDEELVD